MARKKRRGKQLSPEQYQEFKKRRERIDEEWLYNDLRIPHPFPNLPEEEYWKRQDAKQLEVRRRHTKIKALRRAFGLPEDIGFESTVLP